MLQKRFVAAIIDDVVTSFGFAARAIMVRTGRENGVSGILCYSIDDAISNYMNSQVQDTRCEDPKVRISAAGRRRGV